MRMPSKLGAKIRVFSTTPGGRPNPTRVYTLVAKGPNWRKFATESGFDITLTLDGRCSNFWVQNIQMVRV